MRCPLLAALLLPLACLTAQAQHGPAITFGLKGGASLTGVTNRNLASDRYLWGWHAGVTGSLAFTPSFSVQAEALYSQKGFQDDLTAGGISYVNRIRLHYLDLPVLARFNVGGAVLEVGPQLGMLLWAHGYYGPPGTGFGDQTITDAFHRVDVGVVGGIGYQLASGPGIGLRYNTGLLNVTSFANSGSALRNNAFQLYLSYQFSKR